VGTTSQEEKRRFRGRGKRRSGAPRHFWTGPHALRRTEDLREALRARRTPEEPGTSGPPPAGATMQEWNGGSWNGGMMEEWNAGEDSRFSNPSLQYSIVPSFQSSGPPVPFRRWAALPGFGPTQGLPEILRSHGTDRSAADVPREGKSTTRPCPEPPLPTWPSGWGLRSVHRVAFAGALMGTHPSGRETTVRRRTGRGLARLGKPRQAATVTTGRTCGR